MAELSDADYRKLTSKAVTKVLIDTVFSNSNLTQYYILCIECGYA